MDPSQIPSEGQAIDPPLNKGTAGRNLRLTVGAWNTFGLTKERVEYAMNELRHDVLGVCELRGAHTKLQSSCFLGGGQPKAGDSASGVGIVLSKRAVSLVADKGHIGSRIVWVLLRGLVRDQLFVVTYLPHKARKRAPFQHETIAELDAFLAEPRWDSVCKVVLGDLNAKLKRGVEGLTGQYSMHYKSDSGGELVMQMMRDQHLFAASTDFRPGKKPSLGSATYIPFKATAKPTQIDHILISTRWRSAVQSCAVRWGPAIHRFGFPFDHGLVTAVMRFKIRKVAVRKEVDKNWKPLGDQRGLQDEFEAAYVRAREKMQARKAEASLALAPESQEDKDTQYAGICEAITEAKQVLPDKQKRLSAGQVRSKETVALFTEREAQLQRVPRESPEARRVRAVYRNKIVHAARRDYRQHVETMTEEMEEADKVGDSRKIWECVRRLGGKTASTAGVQPSKYKGADLRSPEESAAAWREVAKNKFSCTDRERHRSPLPDLGPAEGRRWLLPTDDVLEVCLAALRRSRAPGLDGIPVEAYQASPSAKRDLFFYDSI